MDDIFQNNKRFLSTTSNLNTHMNTQTNTAVTLMTPAHATALLKANTSNRPLRAAYVERLAKAMFRGEWNLNGDTVRVSKTGRLLDGQHRLSAILSSGMTIQVILVTGLDDDVFPTIDRGIGRTTSDALSMKGEKHSSGIAAVTRLLHIYNQSGNPHNGNSLHHPTAEQQIVLLEKHPTIRTSVQAIAQSKWTKKYVPPSIAAFCHFVFHGADDETASSFFRLLETGAGLEEGSPILLLRNRLTDVHAGKERMDPFYRAAMIFKAFRLHRDGARVKTLRVRTEGDCPEKNLFIL